MHGGRDQRIAAVLYMITFVYMGLIFYLSSLTAIEQPGPLGKVPQVDKLEHAGEFFVLAMLLSFSFQWTNAPTVRRNAWALTLLFAILYALSDELHQSFVEGRTMDALDLLADTAGITVASLLGAWYQWRPAAGAVPKRSLPTAQDSEE